MITIVKHIDGDKFYKPYSCEKNCYRCGKTIKPGEQRIDFASIRSSNGSDTEARLSWDTFCDPCTEGIFNATKKIKKVKCHK